MGNIGTFLRLQAFQQEISLNAGKIELVFRQGESLIDKSEPLDAAVIEEELEDLQRYCQEVFGRVDRYYKKLTRLPVRLNTHTQTTTTKNMTLIPIGKLTGVQINSTHSDVVHTKPGGNLNSFRGSSLHLYTYKTQ